MEDWTIKGLKVFGFKGFVKISDLIKDYTQIPNERGVYLVLKSEAIVSFLVRGSGGYFKHEDPNVSVEILLQKWIETSSVIYIGQAGGIRKEKWSDSTLRKRLKTYINFGQSKAVAHKGGRYIWQIANNQNLIICWKVLPDKISDPSKVESDLIKKFKALHNQYPFANLKG
ncbi:hypothetical protein Q765_13295 [Flavobacterium rivuli WB 3.3-2 = DSM 21788]|uniref:GIY-YIG domain-containing protein n=1 Tax=Flavobacterium rivuli WB 3.3-2 = DSM 21788 TaxID=1121895 RepID=A0A0A2M335_9FLAO|nr:hypothetical protein [Flavobacterium rivuli]KGO86031.1 hypothetical protein Q765_13295 [Flavobacterium rivuli WB 3.3-2 = DSM 21788]